MSDDCPHLESEIDGHKANLTEWINSVKKADVTESHKGVNSRFVRDCETLISDLEAADEPSAADLCDFDDRANSLEIMYNQITDTVQ